MCCVSFKYEKKWKIRSKKGNFFFFLCFILLVSGITIGILADQNKKQPSNGSDTSEGPDSPSDPKTKRPPIPHPESSNTPKETEVSSETIDFESNPDGSRTQESSEPRPTDDEASFTPPVSPRGRSTPPQTPPRRNV